MGGRPKCPMSAYRASAPVTASTTEARATKATTPWVAMKRAPYVGDRALMIEGFLTMPLMPAPAIAANQTSITGPNSRPTMPVP